MTTPIGSVGHTELVMLLKFTPEQQELCKEIIAACKETGERAEACIACGLDAGEELQANTEQLQVAEKMLAMYGQ